jgi:hypothetical protein
MGRRAALSAPLLAFASSHREAPNISRLPTLDATDLYMFNSYEAGRAGYVTILANYIPLQDPYGGPNYFALDQAGLYEIKIDNNGDGVEDLTFQFQFTNTSPITTPESRSTWDLPAAPKASPSPQECGAHQRLELGQPQLH